MDITLPRLTTAMRCPLCYGAIEYSSAFGERTYHCPQCESVYSEGALREGLFNVGEMFLDPTWTPGAGAWIDERFDFTGFHESKAHCRILIYPVTRVYGAFIGSEPGSPKVIVVASELASNRDGTSITNAAESLAAQVCIYYKIAPELLLWVEHYDDDSYDGGRDGEERYDFVLFDGQESSFPWVGKSLGKATWVPASKAEVEAQIGEKLP